MTLKVREIFDQGCRYDVLPIDEDGILAARKKWHDMNKRPPPSHRDLTDNQISVLSRLKDLGHNLLAFDMGVYGPYGTRRERRYMLDTHVQNADGQWIVKEVPGAQS